MLDIIDVLRILLLIVFPLSALITYLVIVNILQEKGNKFAHYKPHYLNIPDFLDLIHSTTQQNDKKYYKKLLAILILSITFFIGTAFSLFYEFLTSDCHDFSRYLKSEVQGEVVDKYSDPENHLITTLSLSYQGNKYNNSDLTIPILKLSDSIKIGDYISKIKGDSVIYIKRNIMEFQIIRTKNNICK